MKLFLKIISCASLILFTTGGFAQPNDRTNIILIVADDLGYADISYNDRIGSATPQLDMLAREGLRFTDFHANAPVCSPTRTAILTGRYQQRSGIESALTPGAIGLPTSEITIADYLKKKGYATAVFGKWHVGTVPEANPVNRGFDEFRGHLNSVDYRSHIGPWGNPDWWFNDNLQNEEGYNSDLIANHAIRFIDEHRDQPFFIYVPFSNIHFPWSTPEDPRFWHEGVNYYESIDTKLGPHSPGSDITLVVRRMIYELDKSVGRIVDAVKRNDLAENTLIFFTSDNGGYIHYQGRHRGQISDNGPLRGQKAELYEGGIRVPAIAWWPSKIAEGSESDEIALTMDLLPTILELAGIMPPSLDSPQALDGISMIPILLENKFMPKRKVFWRFKESGAVRQGPWKLVYNKESKSNPELYNLEKDIGEQKDLAEKHPEIISQLIEAFGLWEIEVDK